MTPTCLSETLREAANDVLEKMFFVQSEGPAEDGPPEELVAVRVDFKGAPSGTLNLRISLPVARGIAADFLGEDLPDLPPGAPLEVVCEMANMICGSVLSRVESETTFRLSPPFAVVEVGSVVQPGEDPACYSATISGGTLSVRMGCDGLLS